MKKRSKFLTRAAIILSAALLSAISIFSISAGAEGDIGEVEDIALFDEDNSSHVVNDAQNTPDIPNGVEDSSSEDNVFALIYDLIIGGADEIFSILTCILSFALMIIYKKGMAPTLEKGVRSLAAGVRGIGERASEIKSSTDSFAAELTDRISTIEASLESLANSLKALTDTLDEREKSSYSLGDLATVMLAEIDMLYEIFNSAELPQYMKERVGERVADMKRKLTGEVEGND